MKNAFFISLITILLVIVAEVLVYFFNIRYFASSFPGDLIFRLSKPEAYSNSPYFSKKFITASMNSGSIFYTPENSRLILAHDYMSDLINVKEGNRVTYPNINSKSKIYIFGGSTVYSGEVPDIFTIPSILSEIISKKEASKVQVINMGMTSVNTSQQYSYLKTINITSDDIVIFYGGVNDILQSLYFGNPDGTIIGEQRDLDRNQKFKAIIKFLSRSNIHKLVKAIIYKDYVPPYLNDSESVNSLQIKLVKNYIDNINLAKNHVESQGGKFLNFLQPNIYTIPKPTKYENELLKTNLAYSLKVSFEFGNNLLHKAHLDLLKNGVNSEDISDLFNNKTEECYLDGFHVTEICNALIAEKFYEKIYSKNDTNLSRKDLNNFYYDYLKNTKKEYLSKNYIAKNLEVLEKITNFETDRFFGSFNKSKFKKGILKEGYIGLSHKPSQFYQVNLNIDCKKDDVSYLSLNNEKPIENLNSITRTPLRCGENIIINKLLFQPTGSSIVVESEEEQIVINSITISKIIE